MRAGGEGGGGRDQKLNKEAFDLFAAQQKAMTRLVVKERCLEEAMPLSFCSRLRALLCPGIHDTVTEGQKVFREPVLP